MASASRQLIPSTADGKLRARQHDAKLPRDLSTAPAWIGSPDLSRIDLPQTQHFPVDKKARPRKRRWGDDWRELVIGASPYNRHVAPIPERPIITVQEVVARRMVKLRARLGITAADLRPAAIALESAQHANQSLNDNGNRDGVRPTTDTRGSEVDIGVWKKEAEEMLSLLGASADRAHEYPMIELKRKMGSSSSRIGREPNKTGAAAPGAASGQNNLTAGSSYRLPEYCHGAPWPRSRPSAEVASRARVARRARAERGASTAADARAELEEKVSACLLDILPEEFCRDAPQPISTDGEGKGGAGIRLKNVNAAVSASPVNARPFTAAGSIPSSAGSATARLNRSPLSSPTRSQQPSKRQRGATATGHGDRFESGKGNEKARRRLAAFLLDHSNAVEDRVGANVKPSSPPSPMLLGRGSNGLPGTNDGTISVKHEFGLGGNELASTAPSESMKANFIGLLEDSLGRGPWADPVASQLARPLDAILAYLPPEGTRLHEQSRNMFSPPGGHEEQMEKRQAGTADDQNQSIPTPKTGIPQRRPQVAENTLSAAEALPRGEQAASKIVSKEATAAKIAVSLTTTMEEGASIQAPRAVWLGRIAAVMEARGDKDGAVRVFGEAAATLTKGSMYGDCHEQASCPQNGFGFGIGVSPHGGNGGNLFPYSARAHHLATIIERPYRRHFRRRVNAQIRAAAALRGYLARAGKRRKQEREDGAASFIGCAWRRVMILRHRSAVKFQAVARGARGRRKYRKLLISIAGATTVQSVVRMLLAKNLVRRMRLEVAAANTLQAIQRGYAVRSFRANAIAERHSELWLAALGLNRVARGFLHRRFAGMVRQFAVDGEIDRAEAEATAVQGAVRLATTRVDLYLKTDVGKADLAQELKRATAADAFANIRRRGASPAERRRESAYDVFNSFDLDGSGAIDNAELEPLLAALGVRLTDAELKVASASLDADGSGDVSFSEFYAWFNGNNGEDDDNEHEGIDRKIDTASRKRVPDTGSGRLSPGARRGKAGMGTTSTVRATFTKAQRRVKRGMGMALQEQARRGVVRRWIISVAREAQVRFRETRPPPLECCVCHQPFVLYTNYWMHFGGGSPGGAGLVCSKRGGRGRLFCHPTAFGEELLFEREAEREWTRSLDEKSCLEMAGIRAEAAEEARLTAEGSTGARELANLAASLLDARLFELRRGTAGRVLSRAEASAKVSRLAFQAFDRDGKGTLEVSDLEDLLGVLKAVGDRNVGSTGGGIETVMEDIDKDQSGQIDLDEFMKWFAGEANEDALPPAEYGVDGGGISAQHHPGVRKRYIEVRGSGSNYGATAGDGIDGDVEGGGKDRVYAGSRPLDEEKNGDTEHSLDTSGGSRSHDSSRSESRPDSSVTTAAARDTSSGKRTQRWAAKSTSLRDWFRATTTTFKSRSKKMGIKRKRCDEENEEGTNTSRSSAVIDDGNKERDKRRRVEGHRSEVSLDGSPGMFSLFGVSLFRGRSPPDPWKRYGKTLRAVAAQEARTLLFRRARLRAQVKELAYFRATRPPKHERWATSEFMSKHSESVQDVTAEADAFFVETLNRNLREVEDAIQMAMAGKTLPPYAPGTTGTPGAVPSPGPSSIASGIDQKSTPLLAATPVASAANNGASMGAGTERDNWPSTQGEHAKIGEAFPSTTLRTREQTDDPARSFASLSILFTRSLGKTWWGRGTKAGVAAGSTTARGRDASDFAATVKAAENDAAAVRRRAFQASVGRATIARTVRRLKANSAMAAAVAAATPSKPTTLTAGGETTSVAVMAAAQYPAGGSGTGEYIGGGAGREGETPAAAASMKRVQGRALGKKALQLFELFDVDGSGAIDGEELAFFLRELGISVSATMKREVFPRLDLDCSGDICREELVAWVEKEGMDFRQTARSRLLRVAQNARARGNTTRRLEHQVKSAMVARARATARAEVWAFTSPLPFSTSALPPRLSGSGSLAAKAPPAKGPSSSEGATLDKTDAMQATHVVDDAVAPYFESVHHNMVTAAAGQKRGRALAERASGRRSHLAEEERAAERELLLQRAEDDAERRVKRKWRTHAGAIELRREQDRIRGARNALELTLREWHAGALADGGSESAAIGELLQQKKEEEKLRYLFRLFDVSCDGCIDAEELGRLLFSMRVRVAEPELLVLLDRMDRDGSGDVDFAEFSAWWRNEGRRLIKRSAAAMSAASASLLTTVAPAVAVRRDARRKLISRARAEARAQVKENLRLEGEAVLLATAAIDSKDFPADGKHTSRRTNRTSEVRGDEVNLSARRVSGVGDGHDDAIAKRLAAARASKLARAEADAYADVMGTLRTPAGKRELARRAAALRAEWKAVVAAAKHIALGDPPPATVGGSQGVENVDVEVTAECVELPLLRFLWNMHRSSAEGTEVAHGDEVEPTELKYLGASLRPLFGAGRVRRGGGGKATIVQSALILAQTARATEDHARRRLEADAGDADDVLTLSTIFKDDSDREVHGLKVLERIGFEDLAASLREPPEGAATDGHAAATRRRPKEKKSRAMALADFATVVRLRLRMHLLVPGGFRGLAKEAMLAEGRAFERHELARAIALEDEEPWRLVEVTKAKLKLESSGGIATADVDRLRETSAGAAKLARALAQGEGLAATECLSFLKTSDGRGELAAARVVARERRYQALKAASTGPLVLGGLMAQSGDGNRHGVVATDQGLAGGVLGTATLRRVLSSFNKLGKGELRCAFSLCEAEDVSGEISKAEAAYVLQYAGIPQTTVATAGRVRVLPPGKSPRSPRRKRKRKWRWRQPRLLVSAGSWRKKSDGAKVCPTDDVGSAVKPVGGDVIAKGDPGRTTDTSEKEEGEGGCKDGSDDDDDDDDDGDERESSHGEFSVDMDMIDDVTCDEGFELGEMEILLGAALGRMTLPARFARVVRLLARRATPSQLAEKRDARMLLMSRARTAGRDKAMHAFENLLTIGTENHSVIAADDDADAIGSNLWS